MTKIESLEIYVREVAKMGTRKATEAHFARLRAAGLEVPSDHQKDVEELLIARTSHQSK